jgi:hypothetical protein
LCLLHKPTQSLVSGTWGKLTPRHTVSFQVLERAGNITYRLQLPEGAHIHDVFHAVILKLFHGEPPSATPALPPLQHGQLRKVPEHIIKAQLHRNIRQVLVKWTGLPVVEST